MNARISSILAPARAIAPRPTARTPRCPRPCARPPQRTYYLGINGRVSLQHSWANSSPRCGPAARPRPLPLHQRPGNDPGVSLRRSWSGPTSVPRRPASGAATPAARKHHDRPSCWNEQRRLVERSGFLCDRCERELSWGRSGEMETAPATLAERGCHLRPRQLQDGGGAMSHSTTRLDELRKLYPDLKVYHGMWRPAQ